MKERPAAPCLISLSRQGQDFLSGSVVLPATEDSPIQAHNVPVSPDNTSCLCWLQPSQGYTIFHSSQQWPVCLHPPYGYYGPQYWHTSLIIQRAERAERVSEGAVKKGTEGGVSRSVFFFCSRDDENVNFKKCELWNIATKWKATQKSNVNEKIYHFKTVFIWWF